MAKIAVESVVKKIRDGGLVVYPTDTVYGLLVDATNESAVNKLISFKERPKGKPISVFVSDFEMAQRIAEMAPPILARLKEILPGPYTVVLKSKHLVSDLLESEKGTLGLRIPQYDMVREVVERFAGPITATSANRSGRTPVHSVTALMNQISEKQKAMIDLVVDIGNLPGNKPSTVIDMTTDDLTVLREGDLKFGASKTYTSFSPEETEAVAAKIVADAPVSRPLVLLLLGDLGAGKTQFVKGVAKRFAIEERIVSPTFVIYYEYRIPESPFKNLIHMDLYNIQGAEEFRYLGMDKYLDEPNIFCIEWGEKSGEIIEKLKEKTTLIYIHIEHVDKSTRKITVSYS